VLLLKDWNYKLQLKLCNAFIRDIPKSMKTDIYDETVTHVVLIHGSAEDCQLRKIYKAPFLIPVTCHQVQKQASHQKRIDLRKPATVIWLSALHLLLSFLPAHYPIFTHSHVRSIKQRSWTAFAPNDLARSFFHTMPRPTKLTKE
jgi:hypothetical protein